MAVRETLDLDLRRAQSDAQAFTNKFERDLKDATKGLNDGLAQASRSLNSTTALGKMQQDLNAAGNEAIHAAMGVDQFRAAQDKGAEASRRAALAHKASEESMRKVGVAAGIAGAAVAAGLGVAVFAALKFDQQMSLVAAVSDASAKRMAELRDAAIKAGQATVFTASEAAQAETELAKAGVSTKDILGGALTGALNLANAGQLELARSATIAAEAMITFGLGGRDVTHIADVLAAGANKSTASVESLAQGMENVGGVAHGLFNVSLEELVGTLSLFDQNSLKGAEGGTALKSALLALATPSKRQREVMEALNLQIYDAQGNFVGLANLADNLRSSLMNATEQERQFALGTIFGSYGIRAANVLFQQGGDVIRKWTKEVNDSGAAQRFASKAMDNLAGDMEQLKGSIETALIRTGSQGNTVLRFMAQRATETLNGISSLPGPLQAIALGLGATAAAGLLTVGVLGTMIPKWHELQASLESSNAAGKFVARNMNDIALAGAGLVTAAAGFAAIGQSAESSAFGIASMAAGGAMLGSVIGPEGTMSGAVIGGVTGAVIGLGKAMLTGGESAEEFKGRVADLAKEITGLGEAASAKKFLGDIGESIDNMAEKLRGGIMSQREFDQAVDTGTQAINQGYKDAVATTKQFMATFTQLSRTAPSQAQQVLEGLKKLHDEAGRPLLPQEVITMLENRLNRGEVAYQKYQERVAAANKENKDVAQGMGLSTDAIEAQQKAVDDAQKAWDDYTNALAAGVPTVQSAFEDALGVAETAAKQWGRAVDPTDFVNSLNQQADAVRNFQANLFALSHFLGAADLAQQLAAMGPKAAGELAQGFVDNPQLASAGNEAAKNIIGGLGDLTDFIKGPFADETANTGYAMGFGFGTGFLDALHGVKPGAKASVEDIIKAMQANEPAAGAAGGKVGLSFGDGTVHGVLGQKDEVRRAAEEYIAAVYRTSGGMGRAGQDVGADAGDGTVGGIDMRNPQVQEAVARYENAVRAAGAGAYGAGYGYGSDIGQGVADGLGDKGDAAARAAQELIDRTMREIEMGIDPGSPSKITTKWGRSIGEGLVVGMGRMESYVGKAGQRLTTRALAPINVVTAMNGAGAYSSTIDRSITVNGGIHNYRERDARGAGTVRALRIASWRQA